VSGTDLAMECARLSHEEGWTLALVGGAPGVAGRAAKNMRLAYPEARVVVVPTPQLSDKRVAQQVADAVRSTNARVVQVALGAPRQEEWLARYLEATGATVGIGVGSALDILSGDQPRAPRWMRDHGLEWAQRLRLEPARLARRYLVEDVPFFPIVAALAIRRGCALGVRRLR
jgi:N-acetylglucosaminyldiphosphoundecaprenol N-acetyl-beta-D-mannosaminyltransferase